MIRVKKPKHYICKDMIYTSWAPLIVWIFTKIDLLINTFLLIFSLVVVVVFVFKIVVVVSILVPVLIGASCGQ